MKPQVVPITVYLFSLLLSNFGVVAQPCPGPMDNNNGFDLNIRSGPGLQYSAFDQVAFGNTLIAISETPDGNGSWGYYYLPTNLSGTSPLNGYIYRESNFFMYPSNSAPAILTVNSLSGGLNVRPYAGATGSNYITWIPDGTRVKIWPGQQFPVKALTNISGTFWYQIDLTENCGQEQGWVSGDFVSVESFNINNCNNQNNEPEIVVTNNGNSISDDASLSYGTPVIVGSSVSFGFTISNTGTDNLTLGNVTENSTQYSISSQITDSNLSPGETTDFTVQFSPTSSGTHIVNVSFSNNDSDENPFNFSITATGEGGGEPEIVVTNNGNSISDDASLSYGTPVIVGSSVSFGFTISNTGTDNLTLGNVTENSTQYSISSQITDSNLSPGETTDFTVQFSPTSSGTHIVNVSFSNNDSDENPFNFSITATGEGGGEPEIVVTNNGNSISDDASLSYGTPVIVGSSVSFGFTISNTGTDNLTLGNVTENSTQYSISSQITDSNLSPGETTDFTVQFSPTSSGTHIVNVSFSNNDSDENPFNFSITATGEGGGEPEIVVTNNGNSISDDASLSYGTPVIVGSSVSFGFTISNTGTDNLTLGNVTENSTQYSISSQITDSNLSPGETTDFTVQFSPTSSGTHIVNVSFSNNDSDENPFNFSITATGEEETPSICNAIFDFEEELILRSVWCPNSECRNLVNTTLNQPIERIIIHHTGGSNSIGSGQSWDEVVADIYTGHVNSIYSDIAYHYFVAPNGNIYEGRAGGPEILGAHAGGNRGNYGSIGIALLGTFVNQSPTTEARESLKDLVTYLCDRYNIDPLGTQIETIYNVIPPNVGQTTTNNVKNIEGHRYFGAKNSDCSSPACFTECPGELFYSELGQFRNEIQSCDNEFQIASVRSFQLFGSCIKTGYLFQVINGEEVVKGRTDENGIGRGIFYPPLEVGDTLLFRSSGYADLIIEVDSEIIASSTIMIPQFASEVAPSAAINPGIKVIGRPVVASDTFVTVVFEGTNYTNVEIWNDGDWIVASEDTMSISLDFLSPVQDHEWGLGYSRNLKARFINQDTVWVTKILQLIPAAILPIETNVMALNVPNQFSGTKAYVNGVYFGSLNIGSNEFRLLRSTENIVEFHLLGYEKEAYLVYSDTTIDVLLTPRPPINEAFVVEFGSSPEKYVGCFMTIRNTSLTNVLVERFPPSGIEHNYLSETIRLTKLPFDDGDDMEVLAVMNDSTIYAPGSYALLLEDNGVQKIILPTEFGDSISFNHETQLLKIHKFRSGQEYTLIGGQAEMCINLILEGSFNSFTTAPEDRMRTTLRDYNLIPLISPFVHAPYYHEGNESFGTIEDIPSNMVDWVLVNLRDGSDPEIIREKHAGALLSDGSITSFNGNSIKIFSISPSGTYLEVIHPSHMPLVSPSPIFPDANGLLCHDFSQDMNSAYIDIQLNDNPLKELQSLSGSFFAMQSGNVQNLDCQIDANDMNLLFSSYLSTSYYGKEDVNLDGVVDANDINMLFGNYNLNCHRPF